VLLGVLVAVCVLGVVKLINHESAVSAEKAAVAAAQAYNRAEARFAASPVPAWLTPLPAHPNEYDTCAGGLCGNSPRNPLQLIPRMRAYLGGHARLYPGVCSVYDETRTRAACPVSLLGRRAGYYAVAIAFRRFNLTHSDRLPAGAVVAGRKDGVTAYFLQSSLVSISLIAPADATGYAQFLRTGRFPPYKA
jgi:hypothetical protein